VNFFDAARLAGKDRAEVNSFVSQTDASAIGDDNDLVLKGIINIPYPLCVKSIPPIAPSGS
jgi:hypothetical protein